MTSEPLQSITDAAVDIVAEAIYESFSETLRWSEIRIHGEKAMGPYRKAARAAMAAMREFEG